MRSHFFRFQRLVATALVAPFPLGAMLLALVIVPFDPATSFAEERVTFQTPPVQPSAFKLKRAKAQGKTLEPAPGMTLSGVYSSPTGDGPHPAVVLIPESVEARASHQAWADFLTENGYATLIVESLISRGETRYRDYMPMNLTIDAHAGLAFLAARDEVDPQRIGLLGFGESAWIVLRTLDASPLPGRPENMEFYAGVAFYPQCDPTKKLAAPVLVLAGGKDTLMSMASCRAMIELNGANEPPSQLRAYPEATHFFDNNSYAKNPQQRGDNWVEPEFFAGNDYDPAIRRIAEQDILSFFRSVNAYN